MWVSVTVLWGGEVGGGDGITGKPQAWQGICYKNVPSPTYHLQEKKWSEWNAVCGKGFSIRAVRLVQGRLPFPLRKTGWHGTLSVGWVFPAEHAKHRADDK